MKKLIVILIISLVIVLSGYFIFFSPKEELCYKTEKIIKGNITEKIAATGTINPITTTIIGTQVSGPIKEVYVDYNSTVKKDQLLAIIDPAPFEALVAEQKANLLYAKAELEKLKAQLELDKSNMERSKALFKDNYIAKKDFEVAQTKVNTAKAQINAAHAKIAQVKAALFKTQTNLRYTKIKSPTNGVVISKDIEVGQTVAASFQTPTLFLVAEDLTKMQIETAVSEADISKIQEGQDVEFTVDSYPEEIFNGKVTQIRNSPETIQNVVTYNVIVQVGNKSQKLKPGMTANVFLITEKKSNILMVSNKALRFIPDVNKEIKRYKTPGVWVLSDEKPVRIAVKTGISDESFTEIQTDKLKLGQEILLNLDKVNK